MLFTAGLGRHGATCFEGQNKKCGNCDYKILCDAAASPRAAPSLTPRPGRRLRGGWLDPAGLHAALAAEQARDVKEKATHSCRASTGRAGPAVVQSGIWSRTASQARCANGAQLRVSRAGGFLTSTRANVNSVFESPGSGRVPSAGSRPQQ